MSCDLTSLWQDHEDAVYYYIRKRVPDEATAKDISQEVLIKIYRCCCGHAHVSNPRAWLFQVAHHTLIDYYRKNQRSRNIQSSWTAEQKNDVAAFQNAAEYILPMISLLPERYREPLYMSEVQGINLKTVAATLNLGLPGVKQRVSRGRKMLKAIFSECCLVEVGRKGQLLSFEIKPDCNILQRYRASLRKRG